MRVKGPVVVATLLDVPYKVLQVASSFEHPRTFETLSFTAKPKGPKHVTFTPTQPKQCALARGLELDGVTFPLEIAYSQVSLLVDDGGANLVGSTRFCRHLSTNDAARVLGPGERETLEGWQLWRI
jgi:hypothetical protein